MGHWPYQQINSNGALPHQIRENQMSNIAHIATVTAYEAKDDTFSAVCRNEATGEIERKKGFATMEEAAYAAQMMAFGIQPCTFAKVKKGGDYFANAWAAV
jgi:hypothetical protein